MKLRRITAAFIAAATIAATAVPAYADFSETVTVAYEATSSAAKWDGKAALKEGKSYVVSSDVTISKAVTIPKGTTVTVNGGKKLTVAKGGSLTINGKLVLKQKAELALNGDLTLNKSRVFSCSGKITLGKTAVLKINGRFLFTDAGSISGTPSKVTISTDAAVLDAGKSSSKAFTNAVNKYYENMQKVSSKGKVSAKTAAKDIGEHYNRHLKLVFTDNLYMTALKSICAKTDVDMVYQAAKGKLNADQFLYDNGEKLMDDEISRLTLGNIKKASDVKSISVKIGETVDCTAITDVKTIGKARFGDITQYWASEATYTIKTKNGKTHTVKNAYICYVYAGGKLQLVNEVMDSAIYK